jgi:hypothetical protein
LDFKCKGFYSSVGPSQKEKLLKAINVPSDKIFVKNQEKEKEHHEDPPVVLNSRDRTKEENPPFFVSLEINDQWLHNCMYDSRASSNIITKGIMQRLGLKVIRPYHIVCAMDSREKLKPMGLSYIFQSS